MENELAKVCVWRESRGEPFEGQVAIAHVINNRAKKQNKTYYEVVTQHLQFSSMTYEKDPQLALYPFISQPSFKQICNIIDHINDSGFPDYSEGATFYRNPKTSTSQWFQQAIDSGKLIKTVTIGNHDFYKEV